MRGHCNTYKSVSQFSAMLLVQQGLLLTNFGNEQLCKKIEL